MAFGYPACKNSLEDALTYMPDELALASQTSSEVHARKPVPAKKKCTAATFRASKYPLGKNVMRLAAAVQQCAQKGTPWTPAPAAWAWARNTKCASEGWWCFFDKKKVAASVALIGKVGNGGGDAYMVQYAKSLAATFQPHEGMVLPMPAGISEETDAKAIGIHVRRGDACQKMLTKPETLRRCARRPPGWKRPCYALAAYLDVAKPLIEKYGMTHVYLATDSQQVVQEAQAMSSETLRFHYLDIDRSSYETDGSPKNFIEERVSRSRGSAQAASGVNASQMVVEALSELSLLSRASAFVGTSRSQYTRAAFLLQYARSSRPPAFSNLDEPWCCRQGAGKGGGHRAFLAFTSACVLA